MTTDYAPVIETDDGPVRGESIDGIDRYLGIPYAAAPLGPLRLQAPARPTPWTEPFDATHFGPTAPQKVYANEGGLPDVPEPIIAGDDFLNMNVWTTGATGAPRPVLVWIHGGGYVAGCSANPWYDGASFARKGLVFASFNYRLGAEGFLEVPGAASNRGLRDWIAALAWVQRNIAAFGGDPAQVTVGGQSAGGGAVAALLHTEAARGLLHRAIIASGVVHLNAQSASQAAETAQRLAAELGTAPIASEIVTKSTDELLQAQLRLGQLPEPEETIAILLAREITPLPWMPVVDGDLLTEPLLSAAIAGRAIDVPLLIGTVADEFKWMVRRARAGTPGVEELAQAHANALFRSPVEELLEARTGTAPVYRYEFQWRTDAYDGSVGAGHSLDIPFFFNTLDAPYVTRYTGPNPPQELAESEHGSLSAFVLTGDPGWPAFEPHGTRATRIFDLPVRTQEGFRP